MQLINECTNCIIYANNTKNKFILNLFIDWLCELLINYVNKLIFSNLFICFIFY